MAGEPHYHEAPRRLVVTGRFCDDGLTSGQLSALICALAKIGYVVQTISAQPSCEALFEYDYVLRFRGDGKLPAVRAALEPFKSARLAGAFDPR